MTVDRHIIWSNYDLDYADWRDDLEAEYPDLTEDERIALMYEINGDYLDDERMNLDVQLSQPILVIADLGLWHGRRMGYKEIASGRISDCLYSDTDYSTWYVDRLGDLRCDAIHHDGTNHYLYRTYKPGVRRISDRKIEGKIIFWNGDPCRHYKNYPQAWRRYCQSLRVFHSPSATGTSRRKVGHYGTVTSCSHKTEP